MLEIDLIKNWVYLVNVFRIRVFLDIIVVIEGIIGFKGYYC